MDFFLTDIESDSDYICGRDNQQTASLTTGRLEDPGCQKQLSCSIQGSTTFDTSLMDEDDIPTRDAGLDLSFSNSTSVSNGLGLPNEPGNDTSVRSHSQDDVEPSTSRITQQNPCSSAFKRKKSKAKRRKQTEKSTNNNSLDFREKLQQLENREFYEEETKPEDCADLPVDRRPSSWETGRPFELEITPQNVDMMLISARFYHQDQVVRLCKELLLRCDVERALYFRFVAEKHELADIVPYLVDFVRAYFTSVVRTHSFLGLGLSQLKILLSDDFLKVESELDVFHAVLAWIDHCKHARIKQVGEAMALVRFHHIHPDDIVRHVEPHKNYFRGPGGREVLLSIYRYHALNASQSDVSALQAQLPPPRHYVHLGSKPTPALQRQYSAVSTKLPSYQSGSDPRDDSYERAKKAASVTFSKSPLPSPDLYTMAAAEQAADEARRMGCSPNLHHDQNQNVEDIRNEPQLITQPLFHESSETGDDRAVISQREIGYLPTHSMKTKEQQGKREMNENMTYEQGPMAEIGHPSTHNMTEVDRGSPNIIVTPPSNYTGSRMTADGQSRVIDGSNRIRASPSALTGQGSTVKTLQENNSLPLSQTGKSYSQSSFAVNRSPSTNIQPSQQSIPRQPSQQTMSRFPSGMSVSHQGPSTNIQPSQQSIPRQPSQQTMYRQPSQQTMSRQPSQQSMSRQPSRQTMSRFPSGMSVSHQSPSTNVQPSQQSMSRQPSQQTMSRFPSGMSVSHQSPSTNVQASQQSMSRQPSQQTMSRFPSGMSVSYQSPSTNIQPSQQSMSRQPSQQTMSRFPSGMSVSYQSPSTNVQPSQQSMSRQPSQQSMSRQPSQQSMSRQPSQQSMSRQPSQQSMSRQPSQQSMSRQPSQQTTSRFPSSMSVSPQNPSIDTRSPQNISKLTLNAAVPSVSEQDITDSQIAGEPSKQSAHSLRQYQQRTRDGLDLGPTQSAQTMLRKKPSGSLWQATNKQNSSQSIGISSAPQNMNVDDFSGPGYQTTEVDFEGRLLQSPDVRDLERQSALNVSKAQIQTLEGKYGTVNPNSNFTQQSSLQRSLSSYSILSDTPNQQKSVENYDNFTSRAPVPRTPSQGTDFGRQSHALSHASFKQQEPPAFPAAAMSSQQLDPAEQSQSERLGFSSQSLSPEPVDQLQTEGHQRPVPSYQSLVQERRQRFENLQTQETKQQPVKKTIVHNLDSSQKSQRKHEDVADFREPCHTTQMNMAFGVRDVKGHCACHCCHSCNGDTNYASTSTQELSEKELDELEERIKSRRKEIERKGLKGTSSQGDVWCEPSQTDIQSVTSVRIHYCRSPQCSPVLPQRNPAVTTNNTSLAEHFDTVRYETSEGVQRGCDDRNTSYPLHRHSESAGNKNSMSFRPCTADVHHIRVTSGDENSKIQNKHYHQRSNDVVLQQNHHHPKQQYRQIQKQQNQQQQLQQQPNRQQHQQQNPDQSRLLNREKYSLRITHPQRQLQQKYDHDSRQDHRDQHHGQASRRHQALNAHNFQRNNQQLQNRAGCHSNEKFLPQSLIQKERSLVSLVYQDHKRPTALNPCQPGLPRHRQDHGEGYHTPSMQRRQDLGQPQKPVAQGDIYVPRHQSASVKRGIRRRELKEQTVKVLRQDQPARRPRSQSPAVKKAQVRGETLPRPRSQPPIHSRRARSDCYFNENALTADEPLPENYPVWDKAANAAPTLQSPPGASYYRQPGEEPPPESADDLSELENSSDGDSPTGTGLIYRYHPYTNHGDHKMSMYADEALVIVVGGLNPKMMHPEIPCRLMDSYDPSNNSWFLLGKLPEARHHHGCVMLDGYLYVVGGSLVTEEDLTNMTVATSSCYRYDFGGNFWTAIAPMSWPRMYHAVAVLEGVIYALGGETSPDLPGTEDNCFLDSCEYYNPDTDEWGPIANMIDGVVGMAVTGFRGLLWVIGGYVERDKARVVLASVECYDPRTNSWISMSPLPTPVCHACVADVMDSLFVVGGAQATDPGFPMQSVGDILQYLEMDDVWVQFTTLSIPRHDAGCCVIGDLLFILGGVCSLTADVLQEVECIDVSTGDWLQNLEPMSSPAMGLACVSVLAEDFQ